MSQSLAPTRAETLAPQTVESWSGKDRADENFPVGSWLIRADLRRHVHAFYAFARNADDIADAGVLAPADKLARLDTMAAVLAGDAPDASAPSAAGLRISLSQTGTTAQHAHDLLHAFRQDATKTRYADWGELLEYCRYSAMPVGRHVLDLHGEDPATTWPPSDALCAALQVLNHVQDCAGDLATLDRCYLPQDMLAQAGLDVDCLRAGAETPALRGVFTQMLDLTAALNRSAGALPRAVRGRRLRLETAIILGLSRRLLRRLREGDPLAGRVRLRRGDVLGAGFAALAAL